MQETTRPRRTPGAGSLYETATGMWRGAYVVEDPTTRARVRRYVSGHSRAEAGRRLREAIATSDQDAALAASPTLGWWATRWLDTLAASDRVRPATLRSYRKVIVQHVVPQLGSWPLADLRPGDVERWWAGLLERGLKPSTVALSRRILAACLADAERDGRAPRNAARLAHAPRVEGTTRRRTLTAAEARNLLDLARDDLSAGLLVTLALGTGARVGELLALTWDDVDLSAGTVSIHGSRSRAGVGPTKSRRGVRTVKLPPFALEALRAEARRNGPVIALPDGRPMTPERAGERWRAFRDVAELEELRFHDLRGTFATLALARGVPAKALADVLGHDPAVLLRTYAGPIENARDTIADAIGEALR
ncbi:MAG: site-specific integrase [Chloroflexi bacterium]|nr:site-specific integrase [Chloroflexota bacterium]